MSCTFSSSSTSRISGRLTSFAGGLARAPRLRFEPIIFRSKSDGGASIQKRSLYGAGALQKQPPQCVQARVLSRPTQRHHSACVASKFCSQLKHETSYASERT